MKSKLLCHILKDYSYRLTEGLRNIEAIIPDEKKEIQNNMLGVKFLVLPESQEINHVIADVDALVESLEGKCLQ